MALGAQRLERELQGFACVVPRRAAVAVLSPTARYWCRPNGLRDWELRLPLLAARNAATRTRPCVHSVRRHVLAPVGQLESEESLVAVQG
jgi:hypothetical protein